MTKAAIRGDFTKSGAQQGPFDDNLLLARLGCPDYNIGVLQLLLDERFLLNENDLFGRNTMYNALYRLFLQEEIEYAKRNLEEMKQVESKIF